MRTAHLIVLLLAVAVAACGDADPVHRRLTASAVQPIANARADVGDDTTTIAPDATTTTPDATTPADATTTPDATTPVDTTTAPDTTVEDTSPGDIVVTPGEPALDVPTELAIPWVAAGGGASSLAVSFENYGDAGPVTLSLSGDAALSLVGAPSTVAAQGSLDFTLRFAGASSPKVAAGTLRVTAGGHSVNVAVWAMAGAALPAPSWVDVEQGPITCGRSATVHLATAPFPDGVAAWTDDRVDIFVPEGFRPSGPLDFVVHFHGFGTTIAATLPAHHYREQLWASGLNAILVTPQGPVNGQSGDFGKLMDNGGLGALLHDVAAILYKEGIAVDPQTGDVVLTEHSGGYQAVAENLDEPTDAGQVVEAHLFDGLYARSDQYIDFVAAGGWLRSDYSDGGGTKSLNQAIVDQLAGRVEETKTAEHLRNADAVVWYTPAVHNDTTWWEQAYAEALRWSGHRSRHGPRLELRSATAKAGTATVRWFSPDDDDLTGFVVQTSPDGLVWTDAASAAASATSATFALSGGTRVRVAPRMSGLDPEDTWTSDAYWVEDDADVLVVDGFDRIFGGSYPDIQHGFMSRVGAAAHAATVSNEAVSEDGFDLAPYRAVLWLVGDESLADHTLDAVEQAKAKAYVDGGGGLVVSGSEVAYDLRSNGATFLSAMGAAYSSDDANSNSAKGTGALSTIASFAFGGAAAPYPEDFPDTLTTATGASAILQYGNGMTAAVGRAGKSAVVGFPLETIESSSDLAAVVSALIAYVAP
ncbi:MAG: hypothetical protein U1F43_09160 [Myxococcota bacterium]